MTVSIIVQTIFPATVGRMIEYNKNKLNWFIWAQGLWGKEKKIGKVATRLSSCKNSNAMVNRSTYQIVMECEARWFFLRGHLGCRGHHCDWRWALILYVANRSFMLSINFKWNIDQGKWITVVYQPPYTDFILCGNPSFCCPLCLGLCMTGYLNVLRYAVNKKTFTDLVLLKKVSWILFLNR